MEKEVIVVGAGFAGSVLARSFAEEGKKVLLLEKRSHIGGNMYEQTRKNKVRVHLYGPHIFHTNDKEVLDYLKKFSGFYFYEHKVLGKIEGKYVPIPFNFKSLEILFKEEKADRIKKKLLSEYQENQKISILELLNSKDQEIKGSRFFSNQPSPRNIRI